MDWMEGRHISQFAMNTINQKKANKVGQALWDFYMFQMHHLKRVHADPHPGNFLVDDKDNLIALDFGCMKLVPDEFYYPYFELAKPENLKDETVFMEKMYLLEILKPEDPPEEIAYFSKLFQELLQIFTQPFHCDRFDFSDGGFFSEIADLSTKYAQDPLLRKMNGNRGSKHFIYI